jgi:GPI ethanolamine phosphate transferase 1
LPYGSVLIRVAVLSILTPFIHKHTLPIGVSTPQNATDLRLTMYFLSFAPLFVILSISVEGLFYAAFAVTLHAWTNVERLLHDHQLSTHACAAVTLNKDAIRIQKEKWRDLQLDDVRIAVFFLFFVQVAFFGTGKFVLFVSFRCLMVLI